MTGLSRPNSDPDPVFNEEGKTDFPGDVTETDEASEELAVPEGSSDRDHLDAQVALQLLRRIQNLADQLGCDSSDVLRKAILRFLSEEEARLGIQPASDPAGGSKKPEMSGGGVPAETKSDRQRP